MKNSIHKKNNKGFSLIELIVVISIMVVLVGILSSVVFNYVKKAKIAKDVQAADELARAVHRCILYSEGIAKEGIVEGKSMGSVAWNKSGADISDEDDPDSILYYLKDELGGYLPVSSYDENCLWVLHVYYKNTDYTEQNLVIEVYLGPTEYPWDVADKNDSSKYDSQYMLYPTVGSYWN